MNKDPHIIACFWTIGGRYVFGDNDHSPWDFQLRAEAAGKAGFRGIGLKHADLMLTLKRHGYAGVRSILADNGLTALELEALFDWHSSGERRAKSDRVRKDLLAAAAVLGAHHIKAAGDFMPDASRDIGPMHDAFQELAHQARAAGTMFSLEPIAFSNVPSIEAALAVIGESAGKGGGLMLDTWHVTRMRASLAGIAKLPKNAIAGAELDDGTLEPVGDPVSDTLDRRRLCGEGEFDLRGFIAAVRATGFDGPWGVEIISEEQRSRTLEEAAQRTFSTTRAQF
jgi:sugar phosphate isomerase/epimerase